MTDLTTVAENEIINLTIEVVSAYVSHNPVPVAELPGLIADVHAAINGLRSTPQLEVQEKALPAVPARKSVTQDFLVCLGGVDGFDQDESGCKSDDGCEVSLRLLAA